MNTAVIIVAGGQGTRMKSEVPKQFLLLYGRPLLIHTIERFAGAIPGAKLVVVLPEEQLTHWASLCEEHGFSLEHVIVAGGETRFHSVRNGLAEAGDCDYIGVHDGVRPLVDASLILRVLEAAQDFGAAIPVVQVSDSLREVVCCRDCEDMSKLIDSKPVDRSGFVAVQTPQFFRRGMLVKAYEQDDELSFTDDASVVESSGHTVTLVPGDSTNIKITNPADLAVAEALLKWQNEA